MATIADVARRAGVSIATVSRVLSPSSTPHPVNAETARRVREAAVELDFVPSALARGLASHRSGLIGLLVPDLADPHYPQVARGAEDAARHAGLALLVCNTLGDRGRFADYLRLLRARRVDAVVLSGGSSLDDADIESVRASGLPAVLIGRPPRPTLLPYVAVDNATAARDATLHLVDGGRSRVVHLGGPPTQSTMADRAAGYRAALAARGLPSEVVETDGTAEDGLRAARDLLGRPAGTRPDGVFAATDRLAIAAIGAAADRGLRVPDDVAVAGFDDLPLAAYLRPSLTTVSQPARSLGEAAMQLVIAALGGEPTTPVVLPAQLVVRASSAAAPVAARS